MLWANFLVTEKSHILSHALECAPGAIIRHYRRQAHASRRRRR